MGDSGGNHGINFIMWWVGSWVLALLDDWGIFDIIGLITFWDINTDILFAVMEIFVPKGMTDYTSYSDGMLKNTGDSIAAML